MTDLEKVKYFGLIGAAGYIAPRHMKAIKDTNNHLVAAMDKNDSVGIIDNYFPEASFFTEFERFDRHLEKIKRNNLPIDYLSICSPNYLHDAHIRFGLRYGADVICEKPLVLNPWNFEGLYEMENSTGKKIYTILQLRLHKRITELKRKIEEGPKDKVYDIDLTYITSRGLWYYTSWKGNSEKSGGIATNIGIHFFDMLIWIFGGVKSSKVHINNHDRSSGYLELQNARVRWFLSINKSTLPNDIAKNGQSTYRSIKIDGSEIEFSDGFNDLHKDSYRNILDGNGWELNESRQAIDLACQIRESKMSPLQGEYHPFSKLPLDGHPFRNVGSFKNDL